MKRYPFMQVDAFTTTPLAGNPCAILFDTDDPHDDTMLAIAKEMNLSETSFVRQSNIADFGVRYFTPAEEIPLAGHPTIATTQALVDAGRITLTGNTTTITFELPVGPIEIEIVATDGRVQRITMSQQKPKFLSEHDPHVVLPLFGLSPEDVLPEVPVQTVSTGTPQLMIPVKNLDCLRRLDLDSVGYHAYRQGSDFFSPHLFCLEGATDAGDTFARHVGVAPDVPEDPFTGSATGGMAAYLWHHGLLAKPSFVAEQGHWMNRPGLAYVELVGPRHDIELVKVGGPAITVLTGEFIL